VRGQIFTLLVFASCLFADLQVFANQINGGGYLVDNSGNLLYLTQFEARFSCPKGTHLPTVREVAVERMKRGARGIYKGNPGDVPPYPYQLVLANNPDRERDTFYYDSTGFKCSKDCSNFWTASYASDYSAYFTDSEGNIKGFGDRGKPMPVRCFPGTSKYFKENCAKTDATIYLHTYGDQIFPKAKVEGIIDGRIFNKETSDWQYAAGYDFEKHASYDGYQLTCKPNGCGVLNIKWFEGMKRYEIFDYRDFSDPDFLRCTAGSNSLRIIFQ
jgi:hypothetical protein